MAAVGLRLQTAASTTGCSHIVQPQRAASLSERQVDADVSNAMIFSTIAGHPTDRSISDH